MAAKALRCARARAERAATCAPLCEIVGARAREDPLESHGLIADHQLRMG